MYDSQILRRCLGRFPEARVLCVGDVMLDEFVYGRVERLSPEAPIPIIKVGSRESMLGGVGNVSRNVVALGAPAVLVAVTGDDPAAASIERLASSEPGLRPHLIVEKDRPTTVKTRFVAEGQQLLRADDETSEWIGEATTRRLIAAVESELRSADVLILSDYTKGVLSDYVLRTLIAAAREAGVPVIADPKRRDFSAYAGVDVLKPNRAELTAAVGRACDTDEQVEFAARALMKDCGIGVMIVSRSEQGMTLVPSDGEALHLPAVAREVYDVSGAGDTVVATTAAALAAGADLRVAARLANMAGGLVVAKAGTAVVTRAEVEAGVLRPHHEVDAAHEVVLAPEAASRCVERWREQGLRVGLTAGCFDLLHPGHISLLADAKAHCDRLIVAVRDDRSVGRLHGEGRPLQSAHARGHVLAALGMVDGVVVTPEEDLDSLIGALRPDVLVQRGSDDSPIRGAEVVIGYGGDVRLVARSDEEEALRLSDTAVSMIGLGSPAQRSERVTVAGPSRRR